MTKFYFAIGSESEPRSSIWRVWTNRGQVYVSPRATGAIMKISLHTPDYWAAALTKESGGIWPQTGSRVGQVWKRPPEFVPGWTQGPTIGVIRTHETHLPPIPHPTKPAPAGVAWVRPPDLGHKVGVTLLFQSDPTARQPLAPGDEMIRSLPLDSETLWLSARWTPAEASELEYYKSFREDMRVTPAPDGEILGASLMWIFETEAGPHIIEHPLGAENVGPPRDP